MTAPTVLDGPELQEVFARLRAVHGTGMAQGQTPCCFVISKDHLLLRALASIFDLIRTEK